MLIVRVWPLRALFGTCIFVIATSEVRTRTSCEVIAVRPSSAVAVTVTVSSPSSA